MRSRQLGADSVMVLRMGKEDAERVRMLGKLPPVYGRGYYLRDENEIPVEGKSCTQQPELVGIKSWVSTPASMLVHSLLP